MTWHTATVPTTGLASLLARIRTAGGTIACSTPVTAGVRVTWTILAPLDDHNAARPTGRQ